MRRREFISLAGVTTVTWPLAARAQQSVRVRHIGVLLGSESNADDPATREFLRQFSGAMKAAGWVEGKNVRIDYRFGGDLDKINASAAELVAGAPDLIYAQGLPAARTLHHTTKTIPVVFTQVADPVGFGLVETIGHPGGNVTGFVVWDLSIGGKWLQLLREVAPELKKVGIIYNL